MTLYIYSREADDHLKASKNVFVSLVEIYLYPEDQAYLFRSKMNRRRFLVKCGVWEHFASFPNNTARAPEKYRQTLELLLPLGTGAGTLMVRGLLQQPPIPRILKQRDSG